MSNADRTVPSNVPSTGPGTVRESAGGELYSLDDSHKQLHNADIDMVNPPSELAQSCLAIVEQRRKGHILLAQATLQLVDLLPDDDAGNEAYGSYLDQLMEINHERALASSRGLNTNNT